MKKIELILTFVFGIILLSLFVLAAFPYENRNGFITTGNESFDTTPNLTSNVLGNWSYYGSLTSCNISNGLLNCTNGGSVGYIHNLLLPDASINFTLFHGRMSFGNCNSSNAYYISIYGSNFTVGSIGMSIRNEAGTIKLRNEQTGITTGILGIASDNTEHEVQVVQVGSAASGTMRVYVNTTQAASLSTASGGMSSITNFFGFGFPDDRISTCNMTVQSWVSYNSSIYGATSITPIVNTTPVLTINQPLNNSKTHNATTFINFTISTTAPNSNLSLFIWLDANQTFITLINSTNTTQGSFTLTAPTLVNEIAGSINNTYFIKINGTDNASNTFQQLFSFNLTNNISAYKTDNVTLTSLPASVGTQLKLNFNLTNTNAQKDNISISDFFWTINGTQIVTANNNTLLNAPNATLNANISGCARTNNGFGSTAWTSYVCSPNATVGDTTAPVITNQSLSPTSGDTNTLFNLSVIATDNSGALNYCRAELNTSGNTVSNITLTALGNNVFADARTYSQGLRNITAFYCADGSNNIAKDPSNFTFTVNPVSSGGGSSGGGGGGGGGASITVQQNVTVILGNLTLLLKPPIINTYFIYTPFKSAMQRFSRTLEGNKILDNCISKVFECSINGNFVNVALNYSNDTIFFNKISDQITIFDKSGLAKTIPADVRFINLAYAIPFHPDIVSKNRIIYRLGNLQPNGKFEVIGFRLWFLLAITIATLLGTFLYIKYT